METMFSKVMESGVRYDTISRLLMDYPEVADMPLNIWRYAMCDNCTAPHILVANDDFCPAGKTFGEYIAEYGGFEENKNANWGSTAIGLVVYNGEMYIEDSSYLPSDYCDHCNDYPPPIPENWMEYEY